MEKTGTVYSLPHKISRVLERLPKGYMDVVNIMVSSNLPTFNAAMDKLRDLLSGRDMTRTLETVAAIDTRHTHPNTKKRKMVQAMKPVLSADGDGVKPTLECTYCKEIGNFKKRLVICGTY